MIVRMWWKLLTIHSRLLLQFGLLKDRLQLAILNAKKHRSRVYQFRRLWISWQLIVNYLQAFADGASNKRG